MPNYFINKLLINYDAIGNLTKHFNPTGRTALEWNAYGKVRQVTTGSATMTFGYDAQQNRLSKTVTTNGVTKTSYYIRDAQGNALAVYERRGSSLIWKEQDLYGSSRLGMAKPEREVTGFFWQSASYTLVAGAKSYELSNHLGNVLAVISDRGELQSAQDYFPFGMAMPGRSTNTKKYQYGFQKQSFDDETSFIVYKYRMHNPSIGRFLSLDPKAKEYPFYSAYAFSGNIVTNCIELEGLQPGRLFDDPDKAADNFGHLFNDNSIRARREYYSEIYAVVDKGVTKFAYATPVKGIAKNVGLGDIAKLKVPKGMKIVAWIHTHADRNPAYIDEQFSGATGDEGYADARNLNAYLVTPGGKLMKYEVATKITTTLNKTQPQDDGTSNSAKSKLVYVVEKGNTLFSIAEKLHTTVQKIKKENGLKSDKLKIGQKLKITN